MTVSSIIDDVLTREGSEFTNDPSDSGGPTKYGITQATLSAWRREKVSEQAVRTLTRDEARLIYYQRYVLDPGFGAVLEISALVAAELVDTGVNTGPARATEMLQRCLNAFNRNQSDYRDVRVDGDCGASTITALKSFLKLRGLDGEAVLLRALNALQGEFYISLAERRPKDEQFVYGWFLNRVR